MVFRRLFIPKSIPPHKAIIDHPEAGLALPGTLASIAIFLMMLPMLANLADSSIERVKQRVVATHLSSVIDAVSEYAKEHSAELLASSTATTATEVAFNDLRTEGLLMTGFADRNAWGQTYRIFVLEPSSGVLQPVVLTYGGRSHSAQQALFANATVPATASLSGASGGFIPTGTLPGQATTELRGAYGGWVLPLSGTNIPIPEPGHLGGMAFLHNGEIRQDYLYRLAIPGKPELNEMHTELDMTTNAIRNVGELQFTRHDSLPAGFCDGPEDEGRTLLRKDHGLYICRDQKIQTIADTGNTDLAREETIVADGAIIAKPQCPEGSGTVPKIFVLASSVAEGPVAQPLVTFQAWAEEFGTTSWRARLRVKTDEEKGFTHPAANYGRIKVETYCAKDTNN